MKQMIKTMMCAAAVALAGMAAFAAGSDATWTELTGSTSGRTLESGYYFISKNTTFSNATAGGSGLSIADGATVYLYVPEGVTLTATGADGEGKTGGGAGILVPSTATLNLIGSGTVNATGGAGGNGGAGSNGTDSGAYNSSGSSTGGSLIWNGYMKSGAGGAGGAGGGGGGAGIGTPGATGLNGGAGGAAFKTNTLLDKGNLEASYQTPGLYKDGNKGSAGGNSVTASAMGNLYLASTLTVNATAGAAGTGGAKGNAGSQGCIKSLIYGYNVNYTFGACGGGGGGGGGYAGAAIGAGGASGAGGGGGGTGGYRACGVNAVQYANGGGGAGGVGGTEGTSGAGTVTRGDTMTGGAGGASGAAGAAGTAKVAGTAEAPEFAVTYLDKDGKAHSSATYAVGSATKITLPECAAGYKWVNTVYGKPCGSPSDLSSAPVAAFTGTINARNVYGDLTFKATKDGEEGNPWSVGGDVVAYMDGTGGLVISGTGVSGDFSKQNPAPWAAFADQIRSVTIEPGVTQIGSRFFKGCTHLGTVTGGKNLTSVGENAFYQCMSLETIKLDNAEVLDSLKNAIVYQTAIDAQGKPYVIPRIDIPGYKNVLYGTNDLSDPNGWQPVDSNKTMEESGYHFFKFVLKKIGE